MHTASAPLSEPQWTCTCQCSGPWPKPLSKLCVAWWNCSRCVCVCANVGVSVLNNFGRSLQLQRSVWDLKPGLKIRIGFNVESKGWVGVWESILIHKRKVAVVKDKLFIVTQVKGKTQSRPCRCLVVSVSGIQPNKFLPSFWLQGQVKAVKIIYLSFS